MKRYLALTALAAMLLSWTSTSSLEARINAFEPWMPGLDTATGPLYAHRIRGSMLAGERFVEAPFELTYMSDPSLEIGGRLGVRTSGDRTGISDMLIGLKYGFLNKSSRTPGVAGEVVVSLPTADYDSGLGAGAAGLRLLWGLEQDIADVTGYFALGFRINAENTDGLRAGNVFSYRIGAGYPYRDGIRLYGELKGFNHGRPLVDGTRTGDPYQELYLAPGVDYRLPGLGTVSAALLIGLTPESSDAGLIISSAF